MNQKTKSSEATTLIALRERLAAVNLTIAHLERLTAEGLNDNLAAIPQARETSYNHFTN